MWLRLIACNFLLQKDVTHCKCSFSVIYSYLFSFLTRKVKVLWQGTKTYTSSLSFVIAVSVECCILILDPSRFCCARNGFSNLFETVITRSRLSSPFLRLNFISFHFRNYQMLKRNQGRNTEINLISIHNLFRRTWFHITVQKDA